MRPAASGWLWVGVMAAAILAGISQRLTVDATLIGPNVWDVAVPVQADLYLLAYLFLPIWILQLALSLPLRAHETWLLRCGTRLRWLMINGRWAAGQATGLLTAWLITSLVLAAGLPWSAGWSHPADPDSHQVLLASLQAGGLSPIVAWVLQWFAYLGLLLLLFGVLAVTTLLAPKPWVRYLAAACVYLGMVVVIRGGIGVGDSMFIYQAVAAGAPVWQPIVVPAGVLTLLAGVFAMVERARRSPYAVSWQRLGTTAGYLFLVITGLAATAANLGEELNLSDLLLAAFYGFDVSQLNVGVYAYFLLSFSGFTLLYLVSAEQRLWPLYQLISIRSGSPRRWMLLAWRDIAAKATAVMLTVVAAAAAIVAVAGRPLTGPGLGLRVYHLIVNSTLQLVLATGLTLIVAYLTRSRGAVLAAIAIIAVVQTPMINISQILPVGLNALGLAVDWSTSLGFTGYLGIAAITAIGLSLAACSRPARQTLERLAA